MAGSRSRGPTARRRSYAAWAATGSRRPSSSPRDEASSVAGLLGTFDRNPANDLETRSGRGIPYTAKRNSGWPPFERFRVEEEFKPKFFDDLYDTVGDSWRIEQRDSLFDYGPGQSTKTFTDRSIPERPLDPAKISDKQRAKAARICNEMGVTEPGPLADCIVDLFVTGRLEFAEDALIEQEISDASFARLAAGAARVGDLSALEANDGSLHIGFNDRAAGGMVDVRLDPARGELPPETIAAADSEPFLFAGPDGGVRAEAAELPQLGRKRDLPVLPLRRRDVAVARRRGDGRIDLCVPPIRAVRRRHALHGFADGRRRAHLPRGAGRTRRRANRVATRLLRVLPHTGARRPERRALGRVDAVGLPRRRALRTADRPGDGQPRGLADHGAGLVEWLDGRSALLPAGGRAARIHRAPPARPASSSSTPALTGASYRCGGWAKAA